MYLPMRPYGGMRELDIDKKASKKSASSRNEIFQKATMNQNRQEKN